MRPRRPHTLVAGHNDKTGDETKKVLVTDSNRSLHPCALVWGSFRKKRKEKKKFWSSKMTRVVEFYGDDLTI